MTARPSLEREFAYTDRDFQFFRELAYAQAGITLADVKRDMVYSRLARCVRRLGLPDLTAYADYLRTEPHEELGHFVNAITTNLTAFFREPHHFEHLEQEVLPGLLQERREGGRVRLWSCAASTGEEPYSIALTLHHALRACPGVDAKILASDIDSDVLAQAAAGIYAEERIEPVPSHLRRGSFLRGAGRARGKVRIQPAVASLLTFRQVNLLAPWPMKGKFDAIFCRNVVIYFDTPTKRTLFDRLADLLQPPGLLYIGHAESLHQITDRFELVGRSIYRKIR